MSPQILKEIEQEITTLLSDLIRINTTNPPGNETQAAKYIAQYLANEGFKTEIIESAPGRGSVITRLKGTGEKPNLLLTITSWMLSPLTLKNGPLTRSPAQSKMVTFTAEAPMT